MAYASRAGLDDCMIAVAVRVIRKLDYAYLKWQTEQAEQRSKYKRGPEDA